jgi:hypothetical protein
MTKLPLKRPRLPQARTRPTAALCLIPSTAARREASLSGTMPAPMGVTVRSGCPTLAAGVERGTSRKLDRCLTWRRSENVGRVSELFTATLFVLDRLASHISFLR